MGDLAELLELVVAQDRLIHHQLMGLLRALAQQVDLRADAGLQAHHDRLADRIDRRVGHLREQLLEVREQRRLAIGEDGQRGVVAHADATGSSPLAAIGAMIIRRSSCE